jgi:glucokinase-like ROK family protein
MTIALGARPENTHQARILRLLRDGGPRSRAEVGDVLGLTRPTVVSELARLEESGLARESGMAASRGGRRSPLVMLEPSLRFVGVDLGATSITVAVTDGTMEVLSLVEAATDLRQGPTAVLAQVGDLIGKLRADDNASGLAGIGMGLPGPVSWGEGSPVMPPLMPGWDRFGVRDALAAQFRCPAFVDNDVNIMALGECWGGVARSVEDVLVVKLGTGIGCGIVVRGQVYRGVDGCAGDIGHTQVPGSTQECTCGNAGCLEATFGGLALARDALAAATAGDSPFLAERLAEAGHLTAEDVGAGVAGGDPACQALVRRGGELVGTALGDLVHFLDPAMIVVGGGLADLGHPLLSRIRETVYRCAPRRAATGLPVVPSELGNRAGVIGATVLASEQVLCTA